MSLQWWWEENNLTVQNRSEVAETALLSVQRAERLDKQKYEATWTVRDIEEGLELYYHMFLQIGRWLGFDISERLDWVHLQKHTNEFYRFSPVHGSAFWNASLTDRDTNDMVFGNIHRNEDETYITCELYGELESSFGVTLIDRLHYKYRNDVASELFLLGLDEDQKLLKQQVESKTISDDRNTCVNPAALYLI